ncbi:MAG: DinB family protein [Bryobacteraceae bacterium]
MPTNQAEITNTAAMEQYKARIAAYTKGKDPIEMQREAPRTLARLIEGLPKEILKQSPEPGKWSIGSILAHLAEDEFASSWRYRQMIENSGTSLQGFDQELWARLGDYESWEPGEAFEMFRLLREANLRMLANLTPEEWQRFGMHSERGRMTVRDLASQMAGHDMNHIEQVRKILSGYAQGSGADSLRR